MSKLPAGYSFREMEEEEFQSLQRPLAKQIFEDLKLIFHARDALSEPEKDSWNSLTGNMGAPYMLRLGVFHGEEFVGWHFGIQHSGEKFYMQNSAILPAYRRKGLYSALLAEVMTRVKAKGFQIIYSRHMATNNAVIIPKLKADFMITAMELSDTFGVLIHLSYYANSLRRHALKFRSGETRPDAEIRKHLEI